MNIKTTILIAFFICFTLSSIAQTQLEMNQSSHEKYERAEVTRNKTINTIKMLYFDKSEFLKAFDKSEDAWEKYRESFMEMLFPGEEKRYIYGSVYPMVYSEHKATFTSQHTKDLQIWVQGKAEGELGLGSVMIYSVIKERKANNIRISPDS
jgi:hypothetical protein